MATARVIHGDGGARYMSSYVYMAKMQKGTLLKCTYPKHRPKHRIKEEGRGPHFEGLGGSSDADT